MDGLVSIIIPARNEPYLKKTILDLLAKSKSQIEIIVVLDGAWPPYDQIIEDPRVIYLHFTSARGMRNAINSAVAIAKGEFLMKLDAHCSFAEGFDTILSADCKENQVMIPRRYRLDPVNWKIIEDGRPAIDYMYLDSEFHGRDWQERSQNPEFKDKEIDYLMSSQGSVWFMPKTLFYKLDLMDEEKWGTFFNEFQEIGIKAWLGGYEVVINKKTWYSHWHKSKSRGYSLPNQAQIQGTEQTKKWREFGKAWSKQIHDFEWLIDKFWPVPTWSQEWIDEARKRGIR